MAKHLVVSAAVLLGVLFQPLFAESDLSPLQPTSAPAAADQPAWYDAGGLAVEGKGWTDTAEPWHRLPARAKDIVRKEVWGLSTSSAGIAVRFVTDAQQISARWTVSSGTLAMSHMPATGMSGLDLYVRHEKGWRWAGAGRPGTSASNEVVLVQNAPAGRHEYMLYLPLYNGTKSLEIGIPAKSKLFKPAARKAKPIVIYGTSICQGGCASRPGMAHVAILGRRLDVPTINLGFSGNGKMEPEMADLLAELDPSVYVLDCLPNMTAEMVIERVEPFVRKLRAAHPDTPIVMAEQAPNQAATFLSSRGDVVNTKNDELRKIYNRLTAGGIAKLTYAKGGDLLGDDDDATVDGTHPTDLGFERMATQLEPVLRPLVR